MVEIYLIGIYGRLSVDEKGEKLDSLQTQARIGETFVKENFPKSIIVDYYLDDDISGTTFQRDELDRLVEDIYSKKINMIIIKDLSRLGRNNAKTLNFLDFLEEHQIRLIAINDNYDSFKDDDDIIGIKTWYNERYVKDISKKTRSNMHQKLKEGEFLGTPPYGYKKEYQRVNNKLKAINKLVIDENVAFVIKEIFDLYINGNGYKKIAQLIEEKGYISPSNYKNYNGIQTHKWTHTQIKRIINNKTYCGDAVQGTKEKISYKTKKYRNRPKELWYITENTHEPIVSKEIWELANEITQKRNHVRNKKQVYLFSSFLECGCCGKSLCVRGNDPVTYVCLSYIKYGNTVDGCRTHRIKEEAILEVLLEDIKRMTTEEHLDKVYEKLLTNTETKNNTTHINSLEKEITKLKNQIKILYEDRLNGDITIDFYKEKSTDLQKKIDSYQMQINEIASKSSQKDNLLKNRKKLEEVFEEIIKTKNINRALLEQGISKIYYFLPDDIKDIEKTMERLKADRETVLDLQINGGLFVDYKF